MTFIEVLIHLLEKEKQCWQFYEILVLFEETKMA